jgi:hypothetical protein
MNLAQRIVIGLGTAVVTWGAITMADVAADGDAYRVAAARTLVVIALTVGLAAVLAPRRRPE